jgi:hypothetical protein
MTYPSDASRWPWRRWFLAGTAAAGAVTTLGGPIAVEGGCGNNNSSCVAACPAICVPTERVPCDGIQPDARAHDASRTDAEADTGTDAESEGSADGGEDAPSDAASDAPSDTGSSPTDAGDAG